MTEIEAQVEQIHATFCKVSGRNQPLAFFQRRWFDLLVSPVFNGDVLAMRLAVGFTAWYLKTRIAKERGGRNPGALKLQNFIEPERFSADFEEAKAERPKEWRMHCQRHGGAPSLPGRPPVLALPERSGEELGKATAANLEALKQSLLEGKL